MNNYPIRVEIQFVNIDSVVLYSKVLYSKGFGIEICQGRMVYWNTDKGTIAYNTNQILSIQEVDMREE